MVGPLIQLGLATAYAAGTLWLIKHEYSKDEKRVQKIPGGNTTVNKVRLVSANYKGKIKVSGIGIKVSAHGYDWATCEYELKLAASEANCNIVLNVTKEGNRKNGFRFEGVAYRKG